MRPLVAVLLTLAVHTFVPDPAVAQTKTFEEKVTVTYVEVPVTVLGRDGNPVRGLTKENFELREDDAKRAIESFELIDFAATETAKAISPLNPASRRNFLLLFDLSFSNPNSIVRAQQAARNFIARSVSVRDLVGIGTIDVDRGFRLLTAFTTDRELLVAAIADPRNFRASDPLQIAASFTLDQPKASMGGVSEKNDVIMENMVDIARQSNRLDESFNRTRIRRQVDMLGDVAKVLQRLAGRKHLVLLSEGFDPRLVTGRAVQETEEQAEENLAITRGQLWTVDSDKRFGNPETQKSISMMAEVFRHSDVILHAVDIQGLRVQGDVRGGAKLNTNEGLFLLANSTGGTVFRNSNDISSEFDRLTRQHEVVYVLGFRAPAGRPGQFHDLKVKLVNAPGGARLQHRGGYYDAGNETIIERALSLAEIVVNDIPQEDIDVAALAAPFPTDDAKSQVPVVLEIKGTDVVKAAKSQTATADIFVYAFDDGGLVRDSVHQRVTLDVAQIGDRLRDSGIRFYGTLHLPPGQYAIKSLVRIAESDTRGYRRIELTVPEHGDVSVVRPLFFEEPGNWVMVKAARDSAKTPYPFILGTDSFIPAARTTLRRGEPRLFALFVYNSEAEEVTFDFTPKATLVSTSAGEGVTKYVFALEGVPENAQELSVAMRKKGSTDERRVVVPIRVQ
ncbi:MAG TPA: VWA domain-containing protein [Thermoanaerobaculia bacterium]|nr:VWA domain-containing protein [Thermoanaerobaculia bacterium]